MISLYGERIVMKDKIVLTEREKDIVFLICEGQTNQEIAKKLFISPHTVKTHIESLFLKVNVRNRVQLSVFAIKNGIIS